MLLDFFKSDSTARPWFTAGQPATFALRFPVPAISVDKYTGIAIANPGAADATLTFSAFGSSGALIAGEGVQNPSVIPLRSGSQFAALAEQIFGAGVAAQNSGGWIQAESTSSDPNFFFNAGTQVVSGFVRIASSNKLTGDVMFGDALDSFSTALPLSSTRQKSFGFSHLASDPTYFTGIVILNTNDTAANATIEVFDSGGNRITGKTEIINSHQRKSQLLTQYFPELADRSFLSGYIEVHSDKPVAGFAIVGTNSLSALSAAPPQAIP